MEDRQKEGERSPEKEGFGRKPDKIGVEPYEYDASVYNLLPGWSPSSKDGIVLKLLPFLTLLTF